MQNVIEPESVVIVKRNGGFVAHMRFSDSKYDADLSSHSKYYLYELIERRVKDISSSEGTNS